MSRGAEAAFGEAAVAVIGLAGRFPRAASVEDFWRNLEQGIECVSFFSTDELRASGIPALLYKKPGYVPARAVVDGVELFDAAFFGLNSRDAAFMDPQHRCLLECAWEAVESAGYDSERYDGAIGVFAGASTNSYLVAMLSHADLLAAMNDFQTIVGNDKDFLATRVSYHLNLRGPSVNVQTACSTSLVAVHLACQSLLTGECDMALAGGVSLRFPQRSGYVYQEGGILSADGHCRAFDAAATGTIGGNGAGLVLLKRLDRALEDGDHIRCVIRGSAINNDGANKVGFTAPSVTGQAAAIAEAIGIAGIDPADISYVEAHGTGTLLGDPIEIAALAEVFGAARGRRSSCAIGTVKTNIGHLDAAAGVAGLIKTTLALEHRQLPPSLNFDSPNPKIRFDETVFHVNRSLTPWDTGGAPRRAGVSSFGIGGTNAHVVLEEAPALVDSPAGAPHHLIVLSARTTSALGVATENLRRHLMEHPQIDLADVAFTLQTGRRAFRHRRAVVCRDVDSAVEALERADGAPEHPDGATRPIVFMFPGQGAQAVNMAQQLYEWLPDFRQDVDACARTLEPLVGLDIRALVYPEDGDESGAADRLNETRYAQPALFVVEYALARLWMRWGIRPSSFIGHSLGEYVAACLAGVLSLDDALALVAARGRLMQQLPPGGMLSVSMPAADVAPLLGSSLSIAAINSPGMCVVSGPIAALASLEGELQRQRCDYRALSVSRAFHSQDTEAILDDFGDELRRVSFGVPQVPYISNVTGRWMQPEDARTPQYWIDQLRRTVRFADGLRTIVEKGDVTLLEVGPGRTLSMLAHVQRDAATAPVVLASLPHSRERRSSFETMLGAAGQLWASGIDIGWREMHRHERRRRVPLPTYPFERRRCWIDTNAEAGYEQGTAVPQEPAVRTDVHPRPPVAGAYVAPSSDVERALAALWGELLGIDTVGIHDNFFDLGGHSLLLTRLISRLRDTFELDVPLREVFRASTIADLAAAITAQLLTELEQMSEQDARRQLE